MYILKLLKHMQIYKDTWTKLIDKEFNKQLIPTICTSLTLDIVRSSNGASNDVTLEGRPLAGLGLQQVVEV